ncbi:MAG TPA: hypothetical protein VFL61_04580 [Gaiellaceae bacterium]|nr:hypothetical protein [Gaiellaceae bacterium]
MAKSDAKVLAKLLKAETKGKLKQSPTDTVKEAGGSDELAAFFARLSDDQIETLFMTCGEMTKMGITGKVDDATVCFL